MSAAHAHTARRAGSPWRQLGDELRFFAVIRLLKWAVRLAPRTPEGLIVLTYLAALAEAQIEHMERRAGNGDLAAREPKATG